MRKLAHTLLLLCCLTGAALSQHKKRPVLGAERLDTLVQVVQKKRVALVVNQTSVLENYHKVHLLDTLLAAGVQVVKVFAPEHGFRGTVEAGGQVHNSRDLRTGLLIESLYGKTNKPSAEQLADLDVVIFDIQDVGTRFYTYISTMHYLMEACAEHHKELIVLDRPNPNDYIDGPLRKPGYASFVGVHPIPILHGLTVGELAQMIRGEGWLSNPADTCHLTVIPMKHWEHGDPYWLPVRPSPNLPNNQAVILYPSLCFFEGTGVSVGRGTYYPFQVLGFPNPEAGEFKFKPTPMPGFDANPLHKNKFCYGRNLREYPFEGGLTLQFVLDFYERMNKKEKAFFTRPNWFDLLAGTDQLRKQIVQGLSEDEIRQSWQDELATYKQMRKKYLLYPDNRDADAQTNP